MKEILNIIDKIRFENVDDFFARKGYIKKIYNQLPFELQEVYKWYFFYQLCMIKNPLKELCWEYINNVGDNAKLNEEYIKLCDKREKL